VAPSTNKGGNKKGDPKKTGPPQERRNRWKNGRAYDCAGNTAISGLFSPPNPGSLLLMYEV
jgi:hypothetical protein